MERVSFSRKLVAALTLTVSILCFRNAYRALSEGGFSDLLASSGASWEAARLAVFLTAGFVCALAALRLSRAADRTAREPAHAAPLFGRGGRMSAAEGENRRALRYLAPLVAVLALLADHVRPWRWSPDLGIEEQVSGEPMDSAPAATEPTSAPESIPSETATAPTPAAEEGADGGAGEAITGMPATKPTGGEAPWPELVLAPGLGSPPQIPAAQPPQTTTPLPRPAPQPTQSDGHRDAVVWLAVAPDGRSIMSASIDHTIKLWDIDKKRLLLDLGAHKDMARSALFLPDAAHALTAGDDGEIVLRALADGAVQHVFSATQHGAANKLALSRDGRRAVSVHEAGTVIAWDIESRSILHVLPRHDWPIVSVAMSADGSLAVSGSIDGTLKLWDIEAGRLMRSWLGHERGAYGAAFTADGREVLTGSGDYTIKLWDVESGREVRRFEGHFGTVYAVAISDDGTRILSGSLDGTARLWDMATGDELVHFSGHAGPVYAVAFAPDGAILTAGDDRTIRIWAAGGEAVAVIPGAPE